MSDGLDEYGPAIAAAPKPTGRPSDYSEELAEAICARLIDGESLRTVCSDADMPNKATVFRWLAKHEAFRDQYARARELQAERVFEECIEIADDSTNDYMAKQLGDDGPTVEVVNHEHIARSRLRVDTRKWMAGKLAPKKFGDKLMNEHSGPDGAPIPVTATAVINLFGRPQSDPPPQAVDSVRKPGD